MKESIGYTTENEDILTDGGISQTDFGIGMDHRVTTADYQAAEWIDEYISNGDFGSLDFDREFTANLSAHTNEVDVEEARDLAFTYCGAVGARAGQLMDESWEDVRSEFAEAVAESIVDDRSVGGALKSLLPFEGHGICNPHRKSEDIAYRDMMAALGEGYEHFNFSSSGE